MSRAGLVPRWWLAFVSDAPSSVGRGPLLLLLSLLFCSQDCFFRLDSEADRIRSGRPPICVQAWLAVVLLLLQS